jgi:amidophosphoribosyltransferase
VPATIGYSEASGIPFEMGLVRSHYVGRTFIEPEQSIRHFGVRLKLSPIADLLYGKRVVVVDDSIVRGTTSRKIVKMLRDAGAAEVHLRIASPPTQYPCYYGVDTPTRSELIASSHSLEEINQYVTSDTLAYLSIESLVESVMAAKRPRADGPPLEADGKRHLTVRSELDAKSFCHACWSGDYPIEFTPTEPRAQLPLLHL